MIRPLRSIHNVAWVALALILPGVISAALLARRPLAETRAASIEGTKQFSRAHGFQFHREGNVLFMTAAGQFDYPDVLAYWSPDSATISDDSKLLGPFFADSVNRYEIESDSGNIVLYTLAKKAIIDSAPLGGSK